MIPRGRAGRGGARCCAEAPRGLPFATFSIAARDAASGMLGVAVSSKALVAGAICPYVRAGVGAVASQAWVNPYLGPRILDLLGEGRDPEAAVREALAGDPYADYRQLNVVAASGTAATYTGEHAHPWCGGRAGAGYAVAGNHLVSAETVAAMAAAFLDPAIRENLADRLIAVLEAGQAAGGDSRGRQSAGVVVMNRTTVPFVDLRVDHHDDPVAELRRVYTVFATEAGGDEFAFMLAASSREDLTRDSAGGDDRP